LCMSGRKAHRLRRDVAGTAAAANGAGLVKNSLCLSIRPSTLRAHETGGVSPPSAESEGGPRGPDLRTAVRLEHVRRKAQRDRFVH
jgi:hypothetical protein